MRITRGNEARRQDFMEEVQYEHHAIVDAIAAHDSISARQHALHHIARGRQRLAEGGVLPDARQKTSKIPKERR